MKKLLIISQHFPPEIGAASNRIKQMVSQFQKHGLDVHVVTMKPNYPNPKLYTKAMMKEEDANINFNLYRSPTIVAPFPDKVLRLLNQLLFICFAIIISTIIVFKNSIKVCITTSPPFLVNFIGVYCKFILRRKWIMEVRDLWPDSLIAVGAVEKTSRLFRILKKLELYFYRKSDRIVVVTNRTKSIVSNQGIEETKIHTVTNGIPNWVLQEKFKKNNHSETFNVCYIGNIGLSQNLNKLIDVADKLKHDNQIQFYIVGEGLAKIELVNSAKEKNLENVTFIPGITDKQALLDWYYKANLGIVSLNKTALFENVIPSKIFEYAACGTNMLFLGTGETAEIIEQFTLGISMNPEVEKVAKVIQDLSKQRDTLQGDPEKRFAFLEKYSWDNLIKKYIEIIHLEV